MILSLVRFSSVELKQILYLIAKDFSIELRQKHAAAGIVLFLFTTVFVIYKSFNQLTQETWNVMYWIIFLFVCLNSILKSFVQEGRDRAIYYYTLFDPIKVILSKIIYNFLFSLVLAVLLFGLLSFFTLNPIKDFTLFGSGLVLACFGISTIFTFVAAISGLGHNNATLMAVMALPIVLPVLLLAIKISAQAIGIILDSSVDVDFMYLIGIDMLMFGLAILLFPILWRA